MSDINLSHNTKSKFVKGFLLVLILLAIYYLTILNKKDNTGASKSEKKTEASNEENRPETGEIDFNK